MDHIKTGSQNVAHDSFRWYTGNKCTVPWDPSEKDVSVTN